MKRFLLIAACLLGASSAFAGDIAVGDLTIENPASHSMVPGAKVGDGYFAVTNHGKEDDRLVSASSERAKSVQLHEMSMNNGVMVMRELKDGLAIPAGQTIKLAPNYHLMFNNVDKAFRQGEEIKATLIFEKAGSVEVSFLVGRIAGPLDGESGDGSDAAAMSGMDMSMPGMNMDATQPPVDPQQTIPASLKTMFETPEKPLTVEPVIVQNDWAIAGWQQDGRGGRALMRKGDHGWRIHLSSGDSLKDAAALEKIGLSAEDSAALVAKLKAAESTLDPQTLARFASFEGTVMMGEQAPPEGHAGHEGHGQ